MENKEFYELIPFLEITDKAREIAVTWMECENKDWIGQKHKLASDIMNYAKEYASKIYEKPTEEVIYNAYVNHQWALAASDDYHLGYEDGFKDGAGWAYENILKANKSLK